MILPVCLVMAVHILVPSQATSLPSYIKVCKKNDHDCYIQHANEAIPHFLNGDKNLRLPKLNPQKVQKIEANAGNLQLTFSNVEFFGLDTTKVLDIDWNYDEHKIYTEINVENIEFISQYVASGKIMVLPVQGSGPCNITFKNLHLKYTLSYKVEAKGSLHYAITDANDNLDWTIEKTYFRFDNLFNGNKAMGDNVNKFINENDQDVLKEMSGVITAFIKPTIYGTYSAILGKVPVEELFLS